MRLVTYTDTVVVTMSSLFVQILSEEELTKEEEKQKKAESYAEAQKRKKEKKAQLAAASQKGQAAASDQPEFTKIDIRVGEITKVRCWNSTCMYD